MLLFTVFNFQIMFLSQLSTAVLSAQDTGSYLAITLGSALVQTKRNFDRYTIF